MLFTSTPCGRLRRRNRRKRILDNSHAEPRKNSPVPPLVPSTQSPAIPDNSHAELGKNSPSSLTPLPGISLAERVRNYIEQYDGGNCFFVAPVAISEHAAAIEGFGSSIEPFRSFDAAFQRSIGFEADIGVREITEKQCPAVSFLARLRGENARAPHLDIDREALRNGDVLNGMVDHYGDTPSGPHSRFRYRRRAKSLKSAEAGHGRENI